MEISKELKIGGHNFKVLCPYSFRERCDVDAQCDKVLNEIRISCLDGFGSERPESNITVDFLHEIIHSVDKIFCNRKLERLGLDVEEEIVSGLSQGLYQVLHDNKLHF